jgi:protein-tyrosine phosphatase
MPNVVDLQRSEDPRDSVHRAVQVLAEGGVVGVPTDSVYAVVASGLVDSAVQRLTELPLGANSHCSDAFLEVAVASGEGARDYLPNHSKLTRRLARRCWPGPILLQICCDHADSAATRLSEPVRRAIIDTEGCIGFRVVAHSVFRQLHRFLAGPIIIRSAYSATGSAITNGQELAQLVGAHIPLILDDGATRYGGPPTIVRVRGEKYDLVCEGVVESAAINQFAKPLLAVVCTGNTCRSPMAEVMLRERLRSVTGRDDAVGVVSAGLAAFQGDPASNQAVEIMGKRGLDLTGHASQPLTEQIIQLADVILTMTRSHRDAILSKFPEISDRVHTLRVDGGDISDPVGLSVEVYEACADQIDQQLAIWVQRIGDQISTHADKDPNISP